MEIKIIDLKCPGCGEPVTLQQGQCRICSRPLLFSSFQSVYEMPMPDINKYASTYKKALEKDPENLELNKSIAMCYLKLKLYDKAQPAFGKAIEDNFDDADMYLYAAVCLLKGKRPFMVTRQIVDQAIEYLNAALMIEQKGIYYYLRAYLKYDHYEMKRLRTMPTFMQDWQQANASGVSEMDKQQLFEILGVQRPNGF